MATSGTVGQTVISVRDMLDQALLRAGLSPSEATSENIRSAKLNLFFILQSLGNKGVNLWALDKAVIGMQPNQIVYPLPVGTIEVLKCLYRTITLPAGGTAISSDGQPTVSNAFAQNTSLSFVQNVPNGNISYTFSNPVTVVNVGILPYGNRTLSLVWEWSSDGITWTQVYASPINNSYVDNVWQYWDIDGVIGTGKYFRVRELAGGTLGVRALVFGSNPQEITISRANLDIYSQQVSKYQSTRQPTQFWYNRQRVQPLVSLWQPPSYAFDQMVFWRTRQIQDVTALNQQVEIPDRWQDPITWQLSYYIHMNLPREDRDPNILKELKQTAAECTRLADGEERDQSPVEISADISAYTM